MVLCPLSLVPSERPSFAGYPFVYSAPGLKYLDPALATVVREAPV